MLDSSTDRRDRLRLLWVIVATEHILSACVQMHLPVVEQRQDWLTTVDLT